MTRAMLWLMGLIRWSLDLSQCLGDELMSTYLSCILWMTDDQMSLDSLGCLIVLSVKVA